MSVQNVLLDDGAEGFLDRLNLDLTSKAVLAFPHGNSKGEEHVLGVGRWRAGTAGLVELTVCLPCFPVLLFDCAVHSRRSNRFPRSVSKTLDFSRSGTFASLHSWLFGNGNKVLKDKRNSLLDRLG